MFTVCLAIMLLRWSSFKVVVDSEDSDWPAWLCPSPYMFGRVITALNGVFMRVDVNDNFFENDVACTTLSLKTERGKYECI